MSQFTLARVAVAVFWLGVWFVAWTVHADSLKHQGYEGRLMMLYCVRIVAPFSAIGALFGRPWIGLAVGGSIFALTVFVLILAVAIGGAWAI